MFCENQNILDRFQSIIHIIRLIWPLSITHQMPFTWKLCAHSAWTFVFLIIAPVCWCVVGSRVQTPSFALQSFFGLGFDSLWGLPCCTPTWSLADVGKTLDEPLPPIIKMKSLDYFWYDWFFKQPLTTLILPTRVCQSLVSDHMGIVCHGIICYQSLPKKQAQPDVLLVFHFIRPCQCYQFRFATDKLKSTQIIFFLCQSHTHQTTNIMTDKLAKKTLVMKATTSCFVLLKYSLECIDLLQVGKQ